MSSVVVEMVVVVRRGLDAAVPLSESAAIAVAIASASAVGGDTAVDAVRVESIRGTST